MRHLLVALLAAAVLITPAAHAAPARAASMPKPVTSVEGIDEYRLPNGLQVLLAPDDSKPTTTVNLTFRVGSRHENYGETGMAHLLEHLVFKGSTKYPNGWGELSRRGYRFNASTWLDRTNYFATFATNDENLDWYLSWLADSMVNAFIAKKDLDTEMTVVRNEMEMGENDASRILFEKTMATMYQWHNYGKSTIGARSDVENVDVGRLKGFYRTYYQPDNATLVVSGKFDPAKTMAWVQRHLGALPKPKRALPRLYTLDPVQDGERSITLRRIGGTPQVMAAYHVPPGPHPDFAAVELLGSILSDAPAGRLHKALVETGRAAGSWAWAADLADPGLLMVGLQLAGGQDAASAGRDAVAVIEGVAAQPVTDEEFRRAQLQWLKGWEQRFTNPEQVGIALSEFVAQGDWRLFFLMRDRVKALTLADAQRVGAAYLVPANRTLGLYLPTDKPVRPPAPQAVDVAAQMSGFKPQPAAERVPAFDAAPANVEAKTQRFTLANGLKAALLPKPTRGQAVQARLQLRFGDAASLQGQGAAGEMVAELLDKGTATMSRQQIRDRLDALKTELSIQGGVDGVAITLRSRREFLPDAIRLVGSLLREPRLEQPAFDEVMAQMRAAFGEQRGEPQALVAIALERVGNPYPKGHPRHARSLPEMEADAAALTLAQVREFHRRFYGASAGEFAAVGDFEPAAVRDALQSALGGFTPREVYARVPNPYHERTREREAIATPDKQNAVLGVVQSLALSDNDADYPAFTLANYILGSGGDSRLWVRIREKEGLSYDVRSTVAWSSREPHSVWKAQAIFAPANLPKVERALREEIDRALKDGFTAAEVEAAKKALLNLRRLSRAQDGTLAGALAGNLELERSFLVSQKVDDAVAALTVEQVNAALRKHLRPAAFATVVGGDFKQP
jgi:zinc protease